MNINIELAKLYMDRGIIDEQEMNTMLAESSELGITIDAYMLKTKARSEREVYSVLSEFYCMQYIQMASFRLPQKEHYLLRTILRVSGIFFTQVLTMMM